MKPRTIFEKAVIAQSGHLRPLPTAPRRWAFTNAINHYAFRLPKGRTTCMDCGHSWLMNETAERCTCPNCKAKLKVKETYERNGAKFTADLQYSASKRDIVFVNSDLYKQGQSQDTNTQQQVRDSWHNPDGSIKRLEHWCKLPLNEQQQADYLAGKKVLVGEGKDRFGNDCTIYFQYDPEKKAPQTTRVYPDRDKVVGVAEESRTQMAVNNDGKTNEATKNVNEPLQRGQTAPKDDSQQKKQAKPKGPKV